MGMQERDMNWFMENEIEPTDEQSAELALNGFAEVDDGQSVTEPEEEAPAETAEKQEAAEASSETPDDKESETSEVEGVLSQDGKTVIPYKVLRGARDQVNDLQAQNAELQARLDELSQQEQNPEDAPAPITEVNDEVLAAEFERIQGKSLEEFREEYGDEQAQLFLNPIRDNLEIRMQLNELRSREDSRVEGERQTVAEMIRNAIDTNPTLADWEQNDPVMWEAAKAVDNVLKADDSWNSKSYEERFAEVVKRLSPAQPTTVPKTKTAEELAAEKIAAAKRGVNTPTSLSSVPGGDPAAETVRDQVEGMSENELISAMSDPRKQEELLSSLI